MNSGNIRSKCTMISRSLIVAGWCWPACKAVIPNISVSYDGAEQKATAGMAKMHGFQIYGKPLG
jgi:hypothetical protein